MSTVRPPSQFSAATLQDGPQQALDYEVAGEKAASLGHAGHVVAERMAALRAFQGDEIDRISLLKATADAVWAYFIQRELCGLRRHDDAIREYGIPREVLVRLGAK
jgi:hypothetical protein